MKATETYLILCKMDAAEITLQEAHEEILRLFSVVEQSEQLREFKEFLQSEYNLPVSNRMVDEYINQC